MLYFTFQPLYIIRAGKSASWTTIAQSTVLSWDRLDRDQVCWKALNEIPFFGYNPLFSVMLFLVGRMIVPETALEEGLNNSLRWCLKKVLRVRGETDRVAVNECKDLHCFCVQNVT